MIFRDFSHSPCYRLGLMLVQELQQQPWFEGENQEDYGVQEGIAPVCSILYQLAGKCNENMDRQAIKQGYFYNGQYYEDDFMKAMYQSNAQYQNEEKVCSFIESLNSGTYTEEGNIYFGGGRVSSMTRNAQSTTPSRRVSAPLKAALILAGFAMAGMAVWAGMLHGNLARKNIPWRPRRMHTENADVAAKSDVSSVASPKPGDAGEPLGKDDSFMHYAGVAMRKVQSSLPDFGGGDKKDTPSGNAALLS